jgi:Ca2+-binding RTX toxin-like protein
MNANNCDRTAGRIRSSIERLENRRLLSASLDSQGKLSIFGTLGDDTITVFQNDTGTFIDDSGMPQTGVTVSVLDNGVLREFEEAKVLEIFVQVFDGNDFVSLDEQDIDLPATMFGGAGNDTLISSTGDDSLFGESGFDQLVAKGGVDHMHGGAQGDNMDGGEGNDVMFGGRGHDFMIGHIGSDSIYGRAGHDELWGNGSVNVDTNPDLIFADDGNDTIFASSNNAFDTLYGGRGYDKAFADSTHELSNASIEEYRIIDNPIDIFNPPTPF